MSATEDIEDFSPCKEIWGRWIDAEYKLFRAWLRPAFYYLYALFIPNIIVYVFIMLFLSPIFLGIAVAYPPLRFLCRHQSEITAALGAGSNVLDLVVNESIDVVNVILSVLTPAFRLWNILWDGIFWLGIQFYRFMGCVVGQQCDQFENMFRWITNIVPFASQIFYIVFQGIGDIFSDIKPVFFDENGPQNLTTVTGDDGVEYVLNTVDEFGNPVERRSLADGLSPARTHRLVFAVNAKHQQSRLDARIPFPGGIPGNCGPGGAPCIDPGAASCTIGSVDVCELLIDVVTFVFSPEPFELLLEIIKLLLDFGLGLVKDAIDLFLNVILPFFEWLIDFLGALGANIIDFFAGLFSNVDALFAWIPDVWDNFIDVFENFANTVFDTFEDLIDSLVDFFENVWNTVENLFEDVYQVIEEVILDVINFAEGLVTDLINQLENTQISIPSLGSGSSTFFLFNQGLPQTKRYEGGGAFPLNGTRAPEGGHGHRRSSEAKENAPRERYMPLKHDIAALRDLMMGNLTTSERPLCRHVLRRGFDPYVIGKMTGWERVGFALCIGWIEVTEYPEHRAAVREARRAADPERYNSQRTTRTDKRFTDSARHGIRQVITKIKSARSALGSKRGEVKAVVDYVRSRDFLNDRVRTQNKRSEASSKSANFSQAADDASRMLRETLARAVGADKNASAAHQFRARLEGYTARQGSTVVRMQRIKDTWGKMIKEHHQARSIHERVVKLFEFDWSLHMVRVRHPRVDVPGTPEHAAYQESLRFKEHVDRAARFLSPDPSLARMAEYLRSEDGQQMHGLLRKSVEGARMQVEHYRQATRMTRDARGDLSKRDYAEDFWRFLTVGIWEAIGQAFLDVIDFFLCNPLPEPVGPGGDPNPNKGHYCLPYINPQAQVPNVPLSLAFWFPSCCPPGFECPREYRTLYGQLRFVVRVLTKEIPIFWGWLTWIPYLGSVLLKNYVTFPNGSARPVDWYCWSICIGESIWAVGIGLWATLTIVAWIIPIVLIVFLLTSCCCVLAFACCRTVCLPCGVCKPKYRKRKQWSKDLDRVRAAVSTIPGLGFLEPEGGRLRAVLGYTSDAIAEHFDEGGIASMMSGSKTSKPTRGKSISKTQQELYGDEIDEDMQQIVDDLLQQRKNERLQQQQQKTSNESVLLTPSASTASAGLIRRPPRSGSTAPSTTATTTITAQSSPSSTVAASSSVQAPAPGSSTSPTRGPLLRDYEAQAILEKEQ